MWKTAFICALHASFVYWPQGAHGSAVVEAAALPREPHAAERLVDVDAPGSARIVVKFVDGSGVRARFGLAAVEQKRRDVHRPGGAVGLEARASEDIAAANRILRSAALQFQPLLHVDDTELKEFSARAERAWGFGLAELATYLQIPLPPDADRALTGSVRDALRTLPSIEIVYVEPLATPGGAAFPVGQVPKPKWSCAATPLEAAVGDLTAAQGFAAQAPIGVGIASAHAVVGGDGSGVRIIDVEGGYLPHSDHPDIGLIGQTTQYYREHGSAVIGVLAARSNGIGSTGLAPGASVTLRSIYNAGQFQDWSDANNDNANVANHLYWAAKHASKGVVLIELQRVGPAEADCPCGVGNCAATPVEYWPAEFDVIQAAVGNGVIVVEAAANSNRSLDHPVFEGLFDRSVRDSGAILVSSSAEDGQTPVCGFSGGNFGSRVDVHAWGRSVVTTGDVGGVLYEGATHCNDYAKSFSGTSSASAIVAGSVAALQGVRQAHVGTPMTPAQMLDLLVNTGTPQTPGTTDQWIGPQPNVADAVQVILSDEQP